MKKFAVLALVLILNPWLPKYGRATIPFLVGDMHRVPFFESSFESEEEVRKRFVLNKIEPYGWHLTSEHKSHGEKSLVIHIESGDNITIGEGADKGVERADVQDPLYAPFLPALDIWHRIDFMIQDEASLPVLDERLVFLHFKQIGGNNPLVSMRYQSGRLWVKIRYADFRATYTGPKPVMGKWYRVVTHSRITKGGDGLVDMYLDGTQIVRYMGMTAYPKQPPVTYNKFGLYRDYYVDAARKLPPMTIYFDHYIRGDSWREVVPEGDATPDAADDRLWPFSTKRLTAEEVGGDRLLRSDFWAR